MYHQLSQQVTTPAINFHGIRRHRPFCIHLWNSTVPSRAWPHGSPDLARSLVSQITYYGTDTVCVCAEKGLLRGNRLVGIHAPQMPERLPALFKLAAGDLRYHAGIPRNDT